MAILLAYIALVIYRIPAVNEKKATAEAVAKIHAQRLTMNDVDGQHLPPPPSAAADATVAGIDANQNGIRDDVELAIFAKYPGPQNLKLRAAELQYAMAEQMYLEFVFNTETWRAVAEQDDRAYQCVNLMAGQTSYTAEVEKLVRNTILREDKFQENLRYQTSFGLPPGDVCDVSP